MLLPEKRLSMQSWQLQVSLLAASQLRKDVFSKMKSGYTKNLWLSGFNHGKVVALAAMSVAQAQRLKQQTLEQTCQNPSIRPWREKLGGKLKRNWR
jgi:hypothetical protein